MINPQVLASRKYDLAERTRIFADVVRKLLTKIPRTISTIEDMKQLARSSGSVGANYLEANEAMSKKDFIKHINICRKEAKESSYWLGLLTSHIPKEHVEIHSKLFEEANELVLIFNASINTAKANLKSST